MSSNATIAKNAPAEHADNTEAKAIKVFLAIVALVIAVYVGAGLTFGLAGVGAIAICMTGLMLLICVLLTQG